MRQYLVDTAPRRSWKGLSSIDVALTIRAWEESIVTYS